MFLRYVGIGLYVALAVAAVVSILFPRIFWKDVLRLEADRPEDEKVFPNVELRQRVIGIAVLDFAVYCLLTS
jgi:hypothetical protein